MSVVIGSYTHSDSITPNKGVCLVALKSCGTLLDQESIARSASQVARAAYACGAETVQSFRDAMQDFGWASLLPAGIDLEQDLVDLSSIRLAQGEVGRVEWGSAPDSSSGKEHRAAIIKLVCDTDFAAKTEAFKDLSKSIVQAALSQDYFVSIQALLEQEELNTLFVSVSKQLKEKIRVEEFLWFSPGEQLY